VLWPRRTVLSSCATFPSRYIEKPWVQQAQRPRLLFRRQLPAKCRSLQVCANAVVSVNAVCRAAGPDS